MSEFKTVVGFEDLWRAPTQPFRRARSSLGSRPLGSANTAARLARVVNHAPEVVVKVIGRTRGSAQLLSHLKYISRRGALALEDHDGCLLIGSKALGELAEDWSAEAMGAPHRRRDTPFSHSLILSMSPGADPNVVREAARAVAADSFAERHSYAFVLHTDTAHPPVHLAVCSRGRSGERFDPRWPDIELWRQMFADALRTRGCEAEATPRALRFVTLKAEKIAVRKMREMFEAGRGPLSANDQSIMRQAALAAVTGPGERSAWEESLVRRDGRLRSLYLEQAALLAKSKDLGDHDLARQLLRFVQAAAKPDTRRLIAARSLRRWNVELAKQPPSQRERTTR